MQNQIANNSYAEVTRKLQAAVQKATTAELRFYLWRFP